MLKNALECVSLRGVLQTVALVALICLSAGPAMGAGEIDPDADEILRSMAKYMGGLKAFSASADIDVEIIDLQGQKLQFSSSGTLLHVRPGKFYSHRRVPTGAFEMFYDGRTMTMFSKERGAYFQIAAPPTLDEAIGAFQLETGFQLSGDDLLFTDPYPGLMNDVVSGSYIGTSWVNGVECHQVAFRAAKVDWQLWVQTGDKPLPMKYIITTKWLTGAPQFSVRLGDWNIDPEIPPGRFDFKPPPGVRRLESLKVNELGEVELGGVTP
jgi:hypothetical protein